MQTGTGQEVTLQWKGAGCLGQPVPSHLHDAGGVCTGQDMQNRCIPAPSLALFLTIRMEAGRAEARPLLQGVHTCPTYCPYSMLNMTILCVGTQLPTSAPSPLSFLAVTVWGTAAVCLANKLNLTVSEASPYLQFHPSWCSVSLDFNMLCRKRNCKISSDSSVAALFKIQGAPSILIMDELARDAGTTQIPIQQTQGGA